MANTIHSCLESWKTVNFSSLLKDLDSIANEIANEKDQSDISRRILSDKNKKFKDRVSVDTRKEVAPLLKSFQTEVDQLEKRNKSLETHLLTFYKRLIDPPNLCSALEIAATTGDYSYLATAQYDPRCLNVDQSRGRSLLIYSEFPDPKCGRSLCAIIYETDIGDTGHIPYDQRCFEY